MYGLNNLLLVIFIRQNASVWLNILFNVHNLKKSEILNWNLEFSMQFWNWPLSWENEWPKKKKKVQVLFTLFNKLSKYWTFFFFWSMHITRAQQMRFSLVTKIFFKLGNGSINIELSNDDSLEWFIYLTINKSEKVIDRWHFEFLKKSRYRKPEVKKQKFLKMKFWIEKSVCKTLI